MFARLTQALVRAFQVAISALRVQNARFEWPNFAMRLFFMSYWNLWSLGLNVELCATFFNAQVFCRFAPL